METLHVLCGTVILLIYLFHVYQKRRFAFWKNLGVPGPKPTYIFGNAKENLLGKKFIGDLCADIYHQYPNDKLVGTYVMTTPILIVRDLDLAKSILIKDFASFSDRGIELPEEGLGKNLFHADVDTWSLLRKRFSPMFASAKLKKMLYLITECSEAFDDYIDMELQAREEWHVNALTARFTISVISACAFGLDANSMFDDFDRLLAIGDRIFKPTWKVFLEFVAPGSVKMLNLSLFDKDTCDFFYELFRKMRMEREGKPKTRHDFMDMLMELMEESTVQGNRAKSDQEISLELTEHILAAQVFLFFGAGYETTSTTMAILLHELAQNQEIQNKVIEEVDRVFEKYDGKLTYEALGDLKYMEMAISEILRMYPIVDPIQRKAVVDYKVPDSDVIIPKGTMVFIPSFGIHRDPKYWPNPDKFDPDRFLPAMKNEHHPMSNMSFGEGPRICIGARFAKLEACVGLANFFRRFCVVPTKRTKPITDYTTFRLVRQPKGGLYVGIKKRTDFEIK